MKKLFMIILLVFGGKIYSQNIKLSEMKKLVVSDMDYFNSFVLTKGFEFLKSDEEKVTYYFDTFKTNKEKYVIGRTENKQKGNLNIMYMVSKKSDFLNIKNQIDKDNFKYVSSESTSEGSHNMYKNQDFAIDIFIADGIYKIYIAKIEK